MLLNCSCTTRLVDICDPAAAPKCFALCLCALVLGIVRLVLRGSDVVPDFTTSSGSAVDSQSFARDRVQVPSFGDGAVLPSLSGVSNFDTFRNGLVVLVFGLAVLLLRFALSVDITSQFLRSHLELRESWSEIKDFLERGLSMLLFFC